jgi:hypothetical protein
MNDALERTVFVFRDAGLITPLKDQAIDRRVAEEDRRQQRHQNVLYGFRHLFDKSS